MKAGALDFSSSNAILPFLALAIADNAIFLLNLESTFLLGAHAEMVRGILATRQRHLQADGKMGRMPSGPTTHFLDPSRSRNAWSIVVRSDSATNRSASRKLLFPEPLGPTSSIRGPSATSHSRMLL